MSIQEGSFTMKKMTGGLLVLATIFAASAGDLTAQKGRRGPQGQGQIAGQGGQRAQMQDMRGRQAQRMRSQQMRHLGAQMQGRRARQDGVEAIMRMRERLELTDSQVGELDGLRSQSVARRNAQMAMMSEMRSKLAAGQIQRSEIMAVMEAQREGADGIREQHRERIDAILTEGQSESLQQMRQVGLAFQAGRAAGAARGQQAGRGVRSQRGARGGYEGQGMRARGDDDRGSAAQMRGRRGRGGAQPPVPGRGMMRGRGGPIGADSIGDDTTGIGISNTDIGPV